MKKIILTIAITAGLTSLAMANALDEYRARTGRAPVQNNNNQVEQVIIPSVPTGAIMAFDLGGSCPAGWTKWNKAAGRVIVGTGTRDEENYKNYQVGGKAKSTVSTNNIAKGRMEIETISLKVKEDQSPPYVSVADTSVVAKECINREKHCTRYPTRPYTIDLGSENAEPMDLRQPFIALTYCRKD